MIKIKELEFDVKTCDICPQMREPFYQGNLCSRCPIFNCNKDEEGFCLVEASDYREEWAKEFANWIANDFADEFYPKLKF